MGGFYSTVGHLVGDAAEKAASITGSAAASKIGDAIETGMFRGVFNPSRSFAEHPYAAKIYQDFKNNYEPLLESTKSRITKQWQATGVHPVTKQPMPLNLEEVHGIAKKQAYTSVFGPHRVRIQSMLKNVNETLGKNKADVLANHLNVLFEEPTSKTSGLSNFDKDMRHTTLKDWEEYITPPSSYKPTAPVEGALRRIRAVLAYKAASIHGVSNLLNITNDAGLVNTYRTLRDIWGPSRQGTIAKILASDAFSEGIIRPLQEHQAYLHAKATNKLFRFIPGGIGEYIHKNMYIPGMSFVRRESLFAAANLGRYMAEEAAARLKAGDSKWALPAFKEMNIDPAAIASQGFQLSPEDVQKAYYHATNNKIFLHPYDDTPTFWRESPFWRSSKAFTGYITKQFALERRVLRKQIQQGDYLAIGRNVALKALVTPLVGASIYELDRLVSGADWDDPEGHYLNRVDATYPGQIIDPMVGRENGADAAKTALNTVDMIGRLGIFGNMTGYIRGMNRADIIERFLPPEANMARQGFQDVDKALHYDSNHPSAAKPLERDALSDFLPYGTGNILSHKLVPTTKEQSDSKFHTFHRQKPKEDSDNPFSYNIDSNY